MAVSVELSAGPSLGLPDEAIRALSILSNYSKAQLISAVASGSHPEFLFFWGHMPAKSGEIGRHVFSQWFPAPFVVEGINYKTAEHWMMAGKARLFGNKELVNEIIEAASPGAAKALGRKVEGFNQPIWEAARFELVVQGNVHKFGQHPALKDYLLATGERVLVEASPVDAVWGAGLPAGHKFANQPQHWRGLNLLGFALMEVRTHFGKHLAI